MIKIRKTRIRKETKASGGTVFHAQYKSLFGWVYFNNYSGNRFCYKVYNSFVKGSGTIYPQTEQGAKELIDFYIRQVSFLNASKLENKIVNIEYQKYP